MTNAIEALRKLGIQTFDTKGKRLITIEEVTAERQLTHGKGIKLYRSASGDIFGMVGVNLPELISERRLARAAVNIRPSLQAIILQMAEQSAEQYPHSLAADNFDFCLHAPLVVGEKNSLELVEGNGWSLHPGMQYKIAPVQQQATAITAEGGRIRASFNNPKHLVGYFLGGNKFSFAIDLEAPTYKVGRAEVFTLSDVFDMAGKTSKCMEVGENPHLPTVNGRLLQLADVLNDYRPGTVEPMMVQRVLDFYHNINNQHHEEATVIVSDEEGW